MPGSTFLPRLGLALLFACAGCAGRADRPTFTAALAPVQSTLRDTATCASCHADIEEEWQSSLHRRSWTDPVFQEGYAVEPEASCRGCHAPRMAVGRAADGVGCTSCHSSEPHETPRPTLASSCAGCHEFRFPRDGSAVTAPQPLMQSTYSEWRRSEHSRNGTRCQDCHMPIEGGHRSHRFTVAENADMLREAISLNVSAQRERGHTIVRAVLAREHVGHAVPTGDPFRRLELRLAYGGEVHEEIFGRTFRGERYVDPNGRVLTLRMPAQDTRLGAPDLPDPRFVSWRARNAPEPTVGYELFYVRASRADDEGPVRRMLIERGTAAVTREE